MFYIVMGVSGSGKSTIGKLLSDRLNCPFYDADDFHPPSNLLKMGQNIPLNDRDRHPWLLKLQNIIDRTIQEQKTAVMACSALKEQYRYLMSANNQQQIVWIYLQGDYQTICDRIIQRKNHFFSQNLLRSQFDTLEEPTNALIFDVNLDPQTIVRQIVTDVKS